MSVGLPGHRYHSRKRRPLFADVVVAFGGAMITEARRIPETPAEARAARKRREREVAEHVRRGRALLAAACAAEGWTPGQAEAVLGLRPGDLGGPVRTPVRGRGRRRA